MSATRVGRKVAVVAAVALAATLPTGSSGQTSSTQEINAYSLTLRDKDQPVHVVASGPISGVGTLTQTDGENVHYVTLHFDQGSVSLEARATAEGWKSVDPRTCTARRVGRGTFTITGGTGAYEGATGEGTFTQGGIAIAQRTRSGKCLGEKTPPNDVVLYIKIKMVGEATVSTS
jgi:hypothetical protein